MVAITPLSHCRTKLLNSHILQVKLTNVLFQFSKIILNIKLPLVIWFILNFTMYLWNQTRVSFSSVLSHKVLSELETFTFKTNLILSQDVMDAWVIFNLTVFIFIIIFTLNFSLCNLAKLGSTENLPTLFILLGLILQAYKLSLMGKLQGRKFLFLSIRNGLIIKQSLSTPVQ